jgi:alpha,alpha-trehalase
VLFQELYQRVELEQLFPDSKTFADAEPLAPPAQILAEYRAAPPRTRADLAAFVAARFRIPDAAPPVTPKAELKPAAAAAPSVEAHIAELWPHLTRAPQAPEPWSSALPLAHKFVVPGGRFREIYYWDSYFTMLGLVRDGRRDTAEAMTDDFADQIDAYGHVPNGSRSYYLSRSQPPVFYLMAAAASEDPDAGWARRLPALKREYAWWMQGAEKLKPAQASAHVVALPDGSILNRYWDFRAEPRDESYREDVGLAADAGRPAPELYRDIRAAAESGWDFSARWFADGRSMRTIETTALIPVDLNSLMFGLEQAIARGCAHAGDEACAAEFKARATRRQAAMNRYLWDPDSATFRDWNWRRNARTDRPTAAMLFPLFTGEADSAQAQGVAAYVRSTLLAPGGLLAAPVNAGQQWDAPNGWAPLQWAAVQGLNAYGQADLARAIAERWLTTVSRVYGQTGKLLEKYDVQTAAAGGGGEYPLQDGFGWTNGVTRALMQLYPEAAKQAPLQTVPPPG